MNSVENFIGMVHAAAEGRSRVELDLLWRVFLQWKPELATNPSKRAELESWLNAAASTGKVSLPKSKKLFDRTSVPPLPLWVAFPVEEDPTERVDHKSFPWCATMNFVAGLPRIPNPEDVRLPRFSGHRHPR